MAETAFMGDILPTRHWKSRIYFALCAAVFALIMIMSYWVLTPGRFSVLAFSLSFFNISSSSISGNGNRFAAKLFNSSILDLPNVTSSGYQILNFSNSDSQPMAALDKELKKLNLTKSQYLTYIKIQKDYKATLGAIPRHLYEPSKKYIKYGPPVNKLLHNTTTTTTGVKKILAWTTWFGSWSWMYENITCAGGERCIGTTNKNELMNSDVVVVHSRDLSGPGSLPRIRHPNQIWLYYAMESPYLIGIQPNQYNGVFNWTATYRRDADVFSPYFSIRKRKTNLTDMEYNKVLKKILGSKTKHNVVHVVSNCNTPHSKRLSYVREMRKYIPVDTYGACGSLRCEKFSAECNAILSSYKFYMSMENSNCRDYLTEKVEHPLFYWNAVPIVMGGDHPENYAEVLPPDSYIHTSGFKSPKELAEYLLLLDKNPDLYAKYHRWRISYELGRENSFFPWCQVCRKLQNASLPSQTYTDFSGWYQEDTCK